MIEVLDHSAESRCSGRGTLNLISLRWTGYTSLNRGDATGLLGMLESIPGPV